jgi:hypothetical protein
MNGKQWTVFGILLGAALALAALGFAAMSTNPPFVVATWVPTLFFIASGIVFACSIGYLIYFKKKRTREQSDDYKDESLMLLSLLDEAYKRLKLITRLTIRKMRKQKWKDVTSAYPYFMSLADVDIDSEIENIMLRNIFYFTTGRPMTIEEDSKNLAKKFLGSSLFTRNPEHIAKDTSIILQEKVPYLKKKLDHDHIYKKLLKRIERENDKYPSETVSSVIDEYLDHSVKINAAWFLSMYDLDHEGIYGGFPLKLKILLWGIPVRMDEEMTKLRKQVALTIFENHKENTL